MKTALIVEDSSMDRETLSRVLREGGFTVTCVGSVEEAQPILSGQPPDLVILDVILPGQSGFELCRQLKSNPTTSKIPIAICSTKETDVDKMWGNMLGADAYLIKPVNPQELLDTARRLAR